MGRRRTQCEQLRRAGVSRRGGGGVADDSAGQPLWQPAAAQHGGAGGHAGRRRSGLRFGHGQFSQRRRSAVADRALPVLLRLADVQPDPHRDHGGGDDRADGRVDGAVRGHRRHRRKTGGRQTGHQRPARQRSGQHHRRDVRRVSVYCLHGKRRPGDPDRRAQPLGGRGQRFADVLDCLGAQGRGDHRVDADCRTRRCRYRHVRRGRGGGDSDPGQGRLRAQSLQRADRWFHPRRRAGAGARANPVQTITRVVAAVPAQQRGHRLPGVGAAQRRAEWRQRAANHRRQIRLAHPLTGACP